MLCQMDWPPKSPNLNPIEMVWDELEHRVKAKQPPSAQHCTELLQDCWKTISGDYLMKLIERMPTVCNPFIKVSNYKQLPLEPQKALPLFSHMQEYSSRPVNTYSCVKLEELTFNKWSSMPYRA